jgi:UDP-glucuronate decarboxylase
MSSTRLLLTGGTGFFGKALLRYWHRLEKDGRFAPPGVTILSRDPARFRHEQPDLCSAPWLRFVTGDVLHPASLPRLDGITHVLHAATDSTLGPGLAPLHRFDQILEGTRHILDLAVRCGARRFLLCSSGGVYGVPAPGVTRIEESFHGIPDPLASRNAYSVAKRAAEHLCSLYADQYGLEVVVARCFAFVGRDLPMDVHFAIGNFIRDALESPLITVRGDGTALRSYLDQRDLAEWLNEMLQRGQAGRAYNVGSDEAICIADLAHLVRDIVSPQKKVEILGAPQQTGDRSVYVPSVHRAIAELGLRVRHPLANAIRDASVLVRSSSVLP